MHRRVGMLVAATIWLVSPWLWAQGHGSAGHGSGSTGGSFGSIGRGSTAGEGSSFSSRGSNFGLSSGQFSSLPRHGAIFSLAVASFHGVVNTGWMLAGFHCDPIWNCWPAPRAPNPRQGKIEPSASPVEQALPAQLNQRGEANPSLAELARQLKAKRANYPKPARVYTNDELPRLLGRERWRVMPKTPSPCKTPSEGLG